MEQTNGKGQAIAALVLGICSLVCCWEGYGALIGLACGVVGMIMASQAKKKGNESTMRKLGFVFSLIGIILSAIFFVACGICTACASAAVGSLDAAAMSELEDALSSLNY